MSEQLLLKSKRNEVLAMIQRTGLDPVSFTWAPAESGQTAQLIVSRLVHPPSGYYFLFDLRKGVQFSEFSPGKDKHLQDEYPGAWDHQVGNVRDWLTYLKREIEAPDLWAAVQAGSAIVTGEIPPSEAERFSSAELEHIRESIDEIKSHIRKSHQLSDAQWMIISARFDYLVESSSRVTRKDWVVIAAGVLTNIAVTAGLNTDVATDLFRFAGQALAWLFGTPPALP